jgi:hypothetical protein
MATDDTSTPVERENYGLAGCREPLAVIALRPERFLTTGNFPVK